MSNAWCGHLTVSSRSNGKERPSSLRGLRSAQHKLGPFSCWQTRGKRGWPRRELKEDSPTSSERSMTIPPVQAALRGAP